MPKSGNSRNHHRTSGGGNDTMRGRPVTDAQPDPNGIRAERRAAQKEASKNQGNR